MLVNHMHISIISANLRWSPHVHPMISTIQPGPVGNGFAAEPATAAVASGMAEPAATAVVAAVGTTEPATAAADAASASAADVRTAAADGGVVEPVIACRIHGRWRRLRVGWRLCGGRVRTRARRRCRGGNGGCAEEEVVGFAEFPLK